jgi:hypothetical protein
MLTAAFDASGHEKDQRFLAVAGFISSAEDWSDFSRRWTERLKQDGIPCFHAAACENNTEEFWGWKKKEKEKTKLKEDLIDIIHNCTYRLFGSTVEIETLGTLSPENLKLYNLRAYALAGRTCAARVREWSSSWGSRYVPELVFEEGDLGSEELETRLVEDGFSRPIFRPKKDKQEKDGQIRPAFIPLQAADFLAYEVFKAHKTLSADRWELEALIRKPGTIGTYTVENMKELERVLALRTEELKGKESGRDQ